MMTVAKETMIFTVIAAIPLGKVASYGQIAAMAGYPKNARLVGSLLKHMPADSSIPWHRVVNSQGQISFAPGGDKYQEQRQKLVLEGVIFKHNKVDMKQCQWQG